MVLAASALIDDRRVGTSRAPFAEIALVAEKLAGEILRELLHRYGIMDIAWGELERHDFIEVIEHQVQLEAEEPAHASCG